MAMPYLLGHDVFRAVWEVTEITDPYSTNQKSECLFLSKHVLVVTRTHVSTAILTATAAGTAVDKSDCQIDFLHSSPYMLECCSNPGFLKALSQQYLPWD
jgi:hypothetical protein